MKEPVKKYNKLVITDEVKEKLNAMLESKKVMADEKIDGYIDFNAAMEDICEKDFYNITRDAMEQLNTHVDFYKDDATLVFEAFADDREKLWNKIVKNEYTMN